MQLTREEAIANHRKMWNWIADETERRKVPVLKHEYFNFVGLAHIHNSCFCCEYTRNKAYKVDCSFCPIDFDSKASFYMCERKYFAFDYKGIYALWVDKVSEKENFDWQNAAKLAREIANLPERGDNHQ